MSSKNLLNVFMALMLAGLLALAIYEPGKPESPKPVLLTTKDIAEVQTINIERPGVAPLLLNKVSGRWYLQSPMKMPANTGRIEQLLNVLKTKSVAHYAMSQVNAQQLQLDSPQLVLTFDDNVLRFGTTDALGGHRYVQVGETVHLITDRYSHLVKGTAMELVSPVMLPEGIAIKELVLPGLHLLQQDDQWRVNGKKADADAVQKLLDEWRHARALRVSKFVPSGKMQAVSVVIGKKDASRQVLEFSLTQNESEVVLKRKDLGIEYHFPSETGQRLLSLALSSIQSED